MRKILLILAITSLAGCATVPGTGNPASFDEFIKNAQAWAVRACGFVPTAATVANIFAAGQFTTYIAIGDAICKAVVIPPGARIAKVTPRVGKVVVRGRFVR